MRDVLTAATEMQAFFQQHRWQFGIIGGISLRWNGVDQWGFKVLSPIAAMCVEKQGSKTVEAIVNCAPWSSAYSISSAPSQRGHHPSIVLSFRPRGKRIPHAIV
jgi:hypothetical protein